MKAAVDEPNLFDSIAEKGLEDLTEAVLVPAEVMLAFNAAMKKKKRKKGQPVPHVVIAKKRNKLTLASSDGKTTKAFNVDVDTQELKFPDVNRLVAKRVKHSFVLGVDLLTDLLRVLRACKVEAVKLSVPENENAPIGISAFSLMGPIDGGIMPMREAK